MAGRVLFAIAAAVSKVSLAEEAAAAAAAACAADGTEDGACAAANFAEDTASLLQAKVQSHDHEQWGGWAPVPPPTPAPASSWGWPYVIPDNGKPTAAPPKKEYEFPYQVMQCKKGGVDTTKCMSTDDYKEVMKAVAGVLDKLSPWCDQKFCPQADWSGCVLRVAGHDFMDFHDGKGGADGCLNLKHHDNAGLPECMVTGEFGHSLNDLYQKFCDQISLADFVVLAGEGAIAWTRAKAKEHAWGPVTSAPLDLGKHFRYGRTTAKECKGAGDFLPNPERGCDAVDDTFVKLMGLTWEESAALMGVHTLGRARPENSGYDGWWASPDSSRKFNNQYYIAMGAVGWMPKKVKEGKHEWVRADMARHQVPEMMLNTDLCLLYTNGKDMKKGQPIRADRDFCCAWLMSDDLKPAIKTDGGRYCGGAPSWSAMFAQRLAAEKAQCCQTSPVWSTPDCGDVIKGDGPAAEAVVKFANDEAYWLKVFQTAWTKATENGFEKQLKKLESSCSR